MKKKDIVIILGIVLIWLSPVIFSLNCNNDYTYHVCSLDGKECFTLISVGEIRYVVNGIHRSVPKTGYAKLDIHKVDNDISDYIVGCFGRNGKRWEILNPHTIVLENKLDTNLFIVKNVSPLNEKGIPTIKDYLGNGCFELGFQYRRLSNHSGDAIVK
jgi:hypothetical protein